MTVRFSSLSFGVDNAEARIASSLHLRRHASQGYDTARPGERHQPAVPGFVSRGGLGFFVLFRLWRGHKRRRKQAIKEQKIRVNDQIRISPIRLIDERGAQVGIVSIEDARDRAGRAGLDLVEVAPAARPPVCRLMDYGKYKYNAARKAKEAKKKQHHIQIKEVKFRPGIENHDYDFKVRHARRFLGEGNKVKLTMMFRGRQLSHPEIGMKVLRRVTQDLEEVAKIEMRPVREGRTMTMVLAPRS